MSSPPSGPAVPRTGGPFLVVPSVEKGRGGGHLSRCAALVREARALGREAFLFPCGPYMPPAPAPAPWTGTVPLLAGLDPSWITPKPAERTWNFIVLDRFQTPPGEYRFWSSLGPLIGVDEGGPCRDRFDFLLDLLPGPPDRSLPNILDPGLLPLPLKRRSAGDSKAAGPLRVLISFGAEDHARLGQSCAAALLASSSRFNIPAWLNLCIWAHPAPAPDRAIRSNKKTICLRGGLSPAGDKVPAGVNRESAGEFFCSASIPCAGKRCVFARIRSPDGKTAADAAVPRREIGPCFHKPWDAGGESGLHITLVDPGGTWAGRGKDPEKFRVLRKIPSLGEHLAEYDLLITHFGLSAFEALYAGVPVILVSPGPYHQRLAKAAGFVSAGIGAAAAKRLGRFLSRDLGDLREHCRSLARRHGLDGEEERGRFADLIVSFRPQFLTRRCPCCGGLGGYVPVRFPSRTFHRCSRCGTIYQSRTGEPPIEYTREYFFEFYKKQYGRTYIEDFPNLISMAEKRLARILPLLPRSPEKGEAGSPKLLDIGCAYGAFLQTASRAGFDVLGLDPAEDAVRYVRDELALQALQGFFPPEKALQSPPGPFTGASFSAITLWYVIEHFPDPAAALEEGWRLLMEGGVLAFSTPSFSGISGRSSPRTFLEKSPGDHWTIWSPRTCRRVLKDHGFRVKRIVVTGHHPERFPLPGSFRGNKKGPVYRFLLLLSRIFGLGDTFEVYAVKESRKK